MINRNWFNAGRTRPAGPKRRLTPSCERMETLCLLSTASPVVSGYVFSAQNLDGKAEAGQHPVAGGKLELLNASGAVVGTATTDAKGFYKFSTDSTASTAAKSATQTLTLPEGYTNLDAVPLSSALQLFDPSLGTLVDVKVTSVVNLDSSIQGENTGLTSSADIRGSVASKYRIDGLGRAISGTVSASSADFQATPYDGTLDFSGTSGVTFSLTPSDTQSLTYSKASDLAAFTATSDHSTVTPTATIRASVSEEGTGNTQYMAATKGSAVVTVTFDYTPSNALKPGSYTVVPLLPTGAVEGKVTSQTGLVVTNGSGTQVIALNLTAAGSSQNDFGLAPAPKPTTTKPTTTHPHGPTAPKPAPLPRPVTVNPHTTADHATAHTSSGFLSVTTRTTVAVKPTAHVTA